MSLFFMSRRFKKFNLKKDFLEKKTQKSQSFVIKNFRSILFEEEYVSKKPQVNKRREVTSVSSIKS